MLLSEIVLVMRAMLRALKQPAIAGYNKQTCQPIIANEDPSKEKIDQIVSL